VAALLAESKTDAASVVAALLTDACDSSTKAAEDGDDAGPNPDEVRDENKTNRMAHFYFTLSIGFILSA